jgi:hypothetical protein
MNYKEKREEKTAYLKTQALLSKSYNIILPLVYNEHLSIVELKKE